jgi:hypothetical protein
MTRGSSHAHLRCVLQLVHELPLEQAVFFSQRLWLGRS